MLITVDLPPPIKEELTQVSRREGISEREHAALLVCLASAFKQDESSTPFEKAVKVFLSHHSLDAERVFSVFDELVRVCLNVHDAEKNSGDFQETLADAMAQGDVELLKHWRNAFVHRSGMDHPLDVSPDLVISSNPPLDSTAQVHGRITRELVSEQGVTDPKEHVRALLAQWQTEDNTPLRPPIPTRSGETPTQALIRKWAEEDAHMTEEAKEAEDRLWEDIEKGIKENRLAFGAR